MSEAWMGAKVMYCGHDGWFVADIFRIGTACVVKANGPISGSNLVRGKNEEATHHVSDFPSSGCWMPERGVFAVPHEQVRTLKGGRR
jgi:hypothetical protein